jgi:hypothetical protein
VPAFVSAVEHRTNIATLEREPADALEMNSIGQVRIDLLRPIAVDLYGKNRSTGAFIVIDPESNGTVAAGMIVAASGAASVTSGPVTAEERAARWGHRGGVLELTGPVELVDRIERSLFARGAVTARIEADTEAGIAAAEAHRLTSSKILSGMIALVVTLTDGETLTACIEGEQVIMDAGDPVAALAAVNELLTQSEILLASGNADWEI